MTLREMEYGTLSGANTVKAKSEGEEEEKEEGEMKRNVVVGIFNLGTVTGKGQKVVDVIERKKIDVLCVQETCWKGQTAREMGNGGYKLYYTGEYCKRNGVGIALSPGLKEGVLQVNQESDRLIWIKLAVGNVTVNVVCLCTSGGHHRHREGRLLEQLRECNDEDPEIGNSVVGS